MIVSLMRAGLKLSKKRVWRSFQIAYHKSPRTEGCDRRASCLRREQRPCWDGPPSRIQARETGAMRRFRAQTADQIAPCGSVADTVYWQTLAWWTLTPTER